MPPCMHMHTDTATHVAGRQRYCDGVSGHCCVNRLGNRPPPKPPTHTPTHLHYISHAACTAGLLLLVTHS